MTQIKCKECDAWANDPSTGVYFAGCPQCTARSIARSPGAWKAARGITAVELEASLDAAFAPEQRAAGKKLVWAWMRRLGVAK